MPELTEHERKFLAFVLGLAFDVMCVEGGFTEADWAAHEKLKKITEGQDA